MVLRRDALDLLLHNVINHHRNKIIDILEALYLGDLGLVSLYNITGDVHGLHRLQDLSKLSAWLRLIFGKI